MANWWDSAPVASPMDVALQLENVPPALAPLARSVYQQESSGGRNTATSNAGAVGGMQIIPATFQSVADDGWDINDPVQNARAGVRYLNQMYERGGNDPRMAAVGYYGGPGAINAARNGQARSDPRNPGAPNTFEYADQVTGRLSPAQDAQPQGNWWESAPVVDPGQMQESVDKSGNWVRWQGDQQPAPEPERPFSEQVGDAIREIPRQVGLTARYGLEGLGQAAGMVTEPLRQGLNMGLRALDLPEAASTAQVGASAADALGLPQPQGANERVVGDITKLMAGAGGIAGGAGALARGVTGLAQPVLQTLGSNVGQQIASAAGAGAAGGAVREAGGGPIEQAIAGLGGGVAAPMALSGIQSAAGTIQRNLPGALSSVSPQQVEQRIEIAMRQVGTDWSKVPERIRQSIRQEARQALSTGGELNPTALRRLLDFQRVEGATPTRGMLSQDPAQITREQNLAKIGANSKEAGLQGLAQVQNQNNAALVRGLNRLGADTPNDAYTAGQQAIGALQARLGSQQARINDLYGLARDSAGRSFPLDGRTFADQAIKALDDNLLGGVLPADVRNHLNRISAGEVPFTVDYAEQLKTLMGRLQRNTSDGSARYALGLVRQALDDAPVLPLGQQTMAQDARAVNPGNLPAVADDATLGREAVQAFNQARSANRTMMRQIERTSALKALYDGDIAPEQFVNKYVIGAPISDAQRLGRMLAATPQAKDAVRSNITQWLKDKALSGAPDDIDAAKFSPSLYAKALNKLNDRKLSAFFDAEEIEQLHALSRVGRLMVNQPVGSAVNNSNTAAALLGRGLDMLGSAGSKLRMLGVGEQIDSIRATLGQNAALKTPRALLNAPQTAAPGQRLIPASLYGSLLAAPAVPGNQNDHRP